MAEVDIWLGSSIYIQYHPTMLEQQMPTDWLHYIDPISMIQTNPLDPKAPSFPSGLASDNEMPSSVASHNVTASGTPKFSSFSKDGALKGVVFFDQWTFKVRIYLAKIWKQHSGRAVFGLSVVWQPI